MIFEPIMKNHLDDLDQLVIEERHKSQLKRIQCPNCRAVEGDKHAWGCLFGTNSKILLKLVKPEPEGLEEEHF